MAGQEMTMVYTRERDREEGPDTGSDHWVGRAW